MSLYFQVFFPTNFEHYIAQMELRDADQNVVDPNPTGGFPIEIETKISKLITYSLAIFNNIEIAKLYVFNKLNYQRYPHFGFFKKNYKCGPF